MASYLLVHGSWHGAWCWEKLAPRLRERGHDVAAIDLPAHGRDRSSPWFVTLGGYAKRVREAARERPEKPILVGHSMGGMVITRAARETPQCFASLVYLCAFAPFPGDSVVRLATSDAGSLIPANAVLCPGGIRYPDDKTRTTFYGQCSDDDVARATARLRPDPVIPLLQRMPAGEFPSLPRGYIECTEDRAVSIGLQRRMTERLSFDRIISLASDHSPFLSMPDELADALDAMSRLADGPPSIRSEIS